MNFCKKYGLGVLTILFLSNTALFAAARPENKIYVQTTPPEVVVQVADPVEAPVFVDPAEAAPGEPSRAERVMKALAEAYPSRIGPAEFRDNDWAVPVYGKWFYYAEGRLLPEELRDHVNEYAAHGFYIYYADLPEWREPNEEESERLRGLAENRRTNTVSRSPHFYNALWRAGNRDEAWDRVKQIRFLGHPVMVHYAILEVLSLVEEKILNEAKTKPEVRQWINSLGSAESWMWRDIADSPNRSFHSYGTAIDILPKSLGGLETYWLWAARRNLEWWKVPYSKRFHPPDAVIKAFESYGFVWGGKWLIYDTMHFEYRPEIFILSNLPMEQFR